MNLTRQLTYLSGNQTVQICLNESSQVDFVSSYIRNGLLNGEAVIVIAEPALRKILRSKIDMLSFDGQAMQSQDQIKFFNANFLLSTLIFDGDLEEKAFQEHLTIPISYAQLNYRKVRVFSEMNDILWKQGQHDMAIKLEGFWNDLSLKQEFLLLNTYSLGKLDPNTYDEALERICKYHSHLVSMEDQDLVECEIGEATMMNAIGMA